MANWKVAHRLLCWYSVGKKGKSFIDYSKIITKNVLNITNKKEYSKYTKSGMVRAKNRLKRQQASEITTCFVSLIDANKVTRTAMSLEWYHASSNKKER